MTIFAVFLLLAGSFIVHRLTLAWVYQAWLVGAQACAAEAPRTPPYPAGSWRARWWRLGYQYQLGDQKLRGALRERDQALLEAGAMKGVLDVVLPEVEAVELAAAPAVSPDRMLS